MTTAQKIIKYLAIAFAIFLIIAIISLIMFGVYALSGVLGLKDNSKINVSGNMQTVDFGSISTNSIKTMIGWHYKLFREAEKQGRLRSIINTVRNLFFGFYKKHKYVVR